MALGRGLTVGLAAGYTRGWVDEVAMRLADIQLSLPYLLFVVAIVGVLGPGLRNVVLVFGIAGFPLFARVARGDAAPYFYGGRRGRYAAVLERDALRARARRLGLWGACPGTPVDFDRGVDTGPAPGR